MNRVMLNTANILQPIRRDNECKTRESEGNLFTVMCKFCKIKIGVTYIYIYIYLRDK